MADEETEPAEAAPELAPPPSRFDAIIDLWFRECIANSVATQTSTAVTNHLLAATADLKRRFSQET